MSLKKFEIQEMVAKGGMAEVYRAKTTGFQGFEKEVCVKKILPHLTEDESFVNMFINEAKLAATLTYANIVSVHDLCVSASGEYFIVMEYVHGKDLSDVIRAAQLAGREIPPDIAVYIVRETCKGLHYAHTKTDSTGALLNIIHRDISPHNVLVSFMGEVKITDFGIAKASSIMNKTAVGILKGKYGYMSPEQARGQPLDYRSDVFNTGIVLYELLVGERCFAGSSDFSTLNLMRNAVVTPPTKINSHITKELEGIVLKALAADRNDRFKDALDMEQALGRYADTKGKRAGAQELSTFMKELFASPEESRAGGSTGVLSLASVVGPAPEDHDQVAQNKPEPKPEKAEPKPEKRKPTERAAELADQPIASAPAPAADEPGREALERAKRRAEKKAEPPPPEEKPKEEEPKAAAVQKPKTTAEEKKAKPEKKAEDKSEKRAASAMQKEAAPPKEPAKEKESAKEKEPPKEEAKAAKAEAPAKEAAKEEAPAAKPERKPARIKQDPAAAKAEAPKEEAKAEKKGGGKQLSDSPKKPVGRKELKPGLTIIAQMSKPQRTRTLVRGTVIVVVALLIGGAVGMYRARQTSRQKTFRDMELVALDPAAVKKPTVTVLITTEPQGATVIFDKNELSERTPLAVERDRDAKPHDIELVLEGFKTVKKTVTYDAGPVTRFAEKLSGEPGSLKVTSKPSDLPVKVDGKLMGNTPVSMEMPSGRREVEIGGGEHEIVKATVDVRAGKTASLSRKVPLKGTLGSLRIVSEPAAQIFIDDEPTGRWTNDGAIDLEPEIAHKVGLMVREQDKQRHELVVKLRKGEKKELFVDLTGPS